VTAGVASCALAVVAQASATSFIITFYDQPNSQGNVLSTATVPVPAAVNGVADVAATLLPVAASVALAPATQLVDGHAGSATLSFVASDAGGNPIAGTIPFSAPIKLVPASSAITFTPNTITSPVTVVTVTYTGAPGTNTNVVAQIGTKSFSTTLPIVANGTPTATPSPVAPALTITPALIGVTVGGAGVALQVSLGGAPGPVALTSSCIPGAVISLSQTSVPAGTPTAVTVTAVTAPSGQPGTPACTVTGTAGSLTASALVNVNQTSATINGAARRTP
jgi:hypothetical protein